MISSSIFKNAKRSSLITHPLKNLSTKGVKKADDVVIVGMARTAITKAKRGNQKDTHKEAMLIPVL